MTQARLQGSIFSLAALLALAAIPTGASTSDRFLRLGESLERVPGGSESRYRAIVDLSRLESARGLELELPGGKLARVERTRLEPRHGGDLLWTGRTELGEEVVLTVLGGRLAGTFFGRERGYRIRPAGEGEHVLLEVDPEAMPACGGAPLLGPARTDGAPRAALAPRQREANRQTARVDVLVMYASASTRAVGSKRDMRTVIQHFVDVTNIAFHNSLMAVRIRLAHTAEVEVPGAVSGGASATLDWLVDSAAATTLRDAHGADLVGLVTEGGGPCGSAAMIYRPGGPTLSRAFFVSRRICGGDTFAHEVGHLMGAQHNPEDARDETGPYRDGRGHYHDGAYRTVMSYTTGCGNGCPAQPFFSNPGVRYQRLRTGVDDERDNARVIDALAPDIAGFSPAIDGGSCELAPGDRDYCLECGPCQAGEGSCETDSECGPGLSCDRDGGPDFGFSAAVGVCRASGACDLAPGDPEYCRLCGPCGFGDGDCDGDRECQAGLVCIDDEGDAFGLPASTDVCGFRPLGFCGANYDFLPPLGDPDFCQVCGPCGPGEGSCKSTGECIAFHTCFADVGDQLGFPSGTGVCLVARPSECGLRPGSADYCKLCGVCDLGEGDCDSNRECRDGLTCVDGGGAAFGFDDSIDVCLERLQAPKRLRARVVSSNRVRLKWKDKSKSEQGFHVEMSTDGGRFERIASTRPNAKKVVVKALESGVTYTFRVQAFSAEGTSPYSNERSVKLP